VSNIEQRLETRKLMIGVPPWRKIQAAIDQPFKWIGLADSDAVVTVTT
jgi:hypothetical protein